MEFKEILSIVCSRRWILFVVTLLVVAIVTAGTTFIKPSYTASTTLRIATAAAGSADFVNYDTTFADRLMSTYARLVSTDGVLGELTQRLGVTQPPKVRADIQANTELIILTVEAETPTLARDGANVLADIIIEQSKNTSSADNQVVQTILDQRLAAASSELLKARQKYAALLAPSLSEDGQLSGPTNNDPARELAKQDVDLKERVYLSVLEQTERSRLSETMRKNSVALVEGATLPTKSSASNRGLLIAGGLLAGVLAGIALALVIDRMDSHLYSTQRIRQISKLPVLAQISTVKLPKRAKGHPTYFAHPLQFFKGGTPQFEAVRRLFLGFISANPNTRSARVVLVTSAEPGEGKSTVVANLAVAIAQSGRRVIAVDADLRRPILHMAFGLFKACGLSDLLSSTHDELALSKAVGNTRIPNLAVLNAGSSIMDMGELISSPRMAEIMLDLRRNCDVVLIDSPPVLAVSDALALATLADATLLVVECGRAQTDTLQAACSMLNAVHVSSLGLVVNRSEEGSDYTYSPQTVQPLQEAKVAQTFLKPPLSQRNGKAQAHAESLHF